MVSAAALDRLSRLVTSEYLEMADLKLTPWQAGKLWNAPTDECRAVLAVLARAGFLRESTDGQYVRRS